MGYNFTITKDGSVGLYDNNVMDIYHSSCGAYKEAMEKFVIPAQLERFKDSTCKVLDICYGIGYNTKALLKYSLKNNLNIKFKIDSLEINKELIEISPFIKINDADFYDYEIDKFILMSYIKKYNFDFNKIKLIKNKNKKYLSINKPDFNKILKIQGYSYGVFDKINSFLHNIYYHNKSISYKLPQNIYNLHKSTLKWHINDARKSILNLDTKYDIIFHDGFTPAKQPLLWSYEFLSEISSHLNPETGILVSYSSAAPFRKVLYDLGLSVGKYYLNNINTTIASYNNILIKYKLDEFELGLLNTKAGIPYRDKNLSSDSERILAIRNKEVLYSDLESANRYYKRNGRKHGKH